VAPHHEGNQPEPGARQIRLRALAHPLRWRLLDLVAAEGSVTATRCAEVTGESVASCSYHLGILRKYGYIEPVPDVPGREKPWRTTTRLLDDLSEFAETKPAAGESDGAAEVAAAHAFIEHQADLMKARLRRESREPAEWRAASLMGATLMYVTADELSQIKDDLVAILTRFADRAADPSSRPPGARAARVFVTDYPDPAERAGSPGETGPGPG
jgi:Helix-turn-helix domain